MSTSGYIERDSYLPGYLVVMGAGTAQKNIPDKTYRMKTSVFDMCEPTLNGLGGTRKHMRDHYPKKIKK